MTPHQSNCDNLGRLTTYYHHYRKTHPARGTVRSRMMTPEDAPCPRYSPFTNDDVGSSTSPTGTTWEGSPPTTTTIGRRTLPEEDAPCPRYSPFTNDDVGSSTSPTGTTWEGSPPTTTTIGRRTLPEHQFNWDNLGRLTTYYHHYRKTHTARASSPRCMPLEEVMEALRAAVTRKASRDPDVLLLAAAATRQMNGIRFTSCKSAKDRTAMSVTIEQSAILAEQYHLADTEIGKAKDILRSEGCRRDNTFKNIGVRKYAFTKRQVAALPADYRPPPGTYGSHHT
ncbi:hypothetical protein JYU34_000091 [Plutella xylostella]|uniref:Uncharacterized protein n=1 Tax=Plutella xylostella TaxID=51655 RepID=A0ABQ7R6T7_PLUXY|nr:hypothetical protein JYU34_000091 [Plutella xylostella]